ncbi:hypothetical protein [Nocardia caishijiensis]|uniref:Uncharacterized protein n=1 Tax=Nocardia caishijiensis TaxID=184756 RepID=A0ABQ6YEJ8_9NOCA|nr:hypothetical protein [Nocardia caishijiensis]KAF0835835.1 hypothetical protein FNL39_11639 [Nocardia caishijiensis]
MPHGPDIAAPHRFTHVTTEGAADMARSTTFRPVPTTADQPVDSRRTRRRRDAGSIRGAQTRSTTVRRPLRIPGR